MKKILLTLISITGSWEAEAFGKRTENVVSRSPAPSKLSMRQGATVLNTTTKTASPQPISTGEKTEILKYADSGVGSPYVWGGSRWDVTNRKILGADCSGFTQKSWGYPSRLETDEAIPAGKRLSTSEFVKAQDAGYPWKRLDGVSHSESLPGDAMVYRGKDRGHIFLVSKTDNSGVVTVEARGKKYGIGYARKSFAYLKNKGYKTIRRNY